MIALQTTLYIHGAPCFVFDEGDLLQALREHVGEDLARAVADMVEGARLDLEEAEEDAADMERSLNAVIDSKDDDIRTLEEDLQAAGEEIRALRAELEELQALGAGAL